MDRRAFQNMLCKISVSRLNQYQSSNSGLGPVDLGRKHGFNYATSSTKEVIFDPKKKDKGGDAAEAVSSVLSIVEHESK